MKTQLILIALLCLLVGFSAAVEVAESDSVDLDKETKEVFEDIAQTDIYDYRLCPLVSKTIYEIQQSLPHISVAFDAPFIVNYISMDDRVWSINENATNYHQEGLMGIHLGISGRYQSENIFADLHGYVFADAFTDVPPTNITREFDDGRVNSIYESYGGELTIGYQFNLDGLTFLGPTLGILYYKQNNVFTLQEKTDSGYGDYVVEHRFNESVFNYRLGVVISSYQPIKGIDGDYPWSCITGIAGIEYSDKGFGVYLTGTQTSVLVGSFMLGKLFQLRITPHGLESSFAFQLGFFNVDK